MTRTFLTPQGNRRISKVGIGEAEYMYAGAEFVSERFSPIGNTLVILHEGNRVILSSSSPKDIEAIKRSLGL